jgi:bifunctional non-homologous end joining protein LigD
MTAEQPEAHVGGIDVRLSHLDKVFFPDDGITKGDLVEYYRQMAPRIIPFTRDRPLVMHRFPEGIAGPRIVQQNVPRYFPDWVTRVEVIKQGGTLRHVLADRPATLVYLANQGFIEFHVFLSRAGALDQPDQVVFDLDPPDQEGFALACRVAVDLRELLTGELELTSYVKTTGGKGLHVHVPIPPQEDFDTVRGFARELASVLASRSSADLTTEQRRGQREGRLYLDVMRNAYAQTVVAPYTVRARPGATVATPVHWTEVENGGFTPLRFTLRTMAAELSDREDPWADMGEHRPALPAPPG